ncbi:MAG TPA: hypothetical protein VHS79_18060 [Actinomycetes bacterium]|jgi:uncharacterized membrane protein|nr:hypothetical protein [Actinomycetes bacterium]
MTEGPSPRDPRDEPAREPLGGPDAPVDQPPPDYRPADTTPGAHDAPRWESPGTPPPPPPPQGGTWDPGPSSTPPPPPPPAGDPGWGQQGQYGQQPGGQYPGGQYPAAGSGMAENVASGLSYVLTWLTGLIFFLVDKRPEVRFHAMQSIAYGVLWTLIAVVRPYMPGPIGALFGIVLFAFFIGWIVLMIQGFQGRHFKLPVIGDFAEQQAGRPGI